MNKICIVDDDPSILEVIKIVLEEAGYEVIIISDPKQVEKKIHKSLPSLILLDVWVAGRNGQEIAKKIKHDKITAKIPIIMISALSNIQEISKKAKVDGFIEKPFDIDELLKTVKKHIRK